MELWDSILDVVLLLTGALLLGTLFARAQQSALVGYLVAGALLGPGVLNVIRNEAEIRVLADLGVALLLFTIGLEFSWLRLKRLGAIALGGGSLQVLLTGTLAAGVGVAMGLPVATAVAIGAVLAPSSTACVLRTLGDRAELESIHGRASLGILLLQDAALIPLVLVLSTLRSEGPLLHVAVIFLGQVLLAYLLFVVLWFLCTRVVPRLFDVASTARNRELPILLAVTMCLASAWAAHAIDLSPALGAFVAGLLLAGTPYATAIRADVGVLRTVFVTLFFTSVGMLTDLNWIAEHVWWLLAFVPAVIIGKASIIWFVGRRFHLPTRHAIAAGLCLGQIGEFSFVLAGVAHAGGLLGPEVFRLIVATTVLTLLVTPTLVRFGPVVGLWVERKLSGSKRVVDAEPLARFGKVLSDHVVIVGYGPAGRAVLDAVTSVDVVPVVVDLNPRSIAEAQADGLRAHLGDATQGAVLSHLNVTSARAVVITLPDHRAALQVAQQVRILAPNTKLFARARFNVYAEDLAEQGALIVDEESITGHELGAALLRDLKS